MKDIFFKFFLLLAFASFTFNATGQIEFSDYFESYPVADGSFDFGGNWWLFGNFPFGSYGAFPAPNGTGGAGEIRTLEEMGGGCNDNQFYNVFNDYNANALHTAGIFVETLIYQERVISANDVGRTYVFQFDHRVTQELDAMGIPFTPIPNDPNVAEISAFIRVIAFSNIIVNQALPTGTVIDWTTSSLMITIDAGMVGSLLQFGFSSTATNFAPTGVWYDNVYFGENPPTAMVPGVVGSTCDDGNPDTSGDTFNADCECIGEEIAPIPTLGEWGLIFMSLMLFIVGLVYIRQPSLQPIRQKK